MGIDINRRAIFKGSPEDFLNRLARYFRGRRIAFGQCGETQWQANLLHRAALFLTVTQDGLEISAQTNVFGPGYHDYVINLLDEMTYKTRLSWVDDEDDEPDETGYWQHRNFQELQTSHADWLRLLISVILEKDPENFGPPQKDRHQVPGLVCMSPNILPLGPQLVSMPLGPKSREELEALKDDPSRFFIWWEKSIHPSFFRRNWQHPATFYLKYALNFMWENINWLPPETDEEKQLIDQTLYYLNLAWNSDPILNFPVAEWLEMASLTGDELLVETLTHRFPDHQTRQPAIGYRRGQIEATCGGPWSLILPGTLHHQITEDNMMVWWNDEFKIKTKVSPLLHRDSGQEITPDEFFENLREAFICHHPFILKSAPEVRALMRHHHEDKNYTSLVAAAGDTSVLMLIYPSQPNGETLAEEICTWLRIKQ